MERVINIVQRWPADFPLGALAALKSFLTPRAPLTGAQLQSNLAVVAALAPVCADKFRAQPDAAAKTVALSKVDSWKRAEEFSKEHPDGELAAGFVTTSCYYVRYFLQCVAELLQQWNGKGPKRKLPERLGVTMTLQIAATGASILTELALIGASAYEMGQRPVAAIAVRVEDVFDP
jgi:hypothetical protein